MLKLFILRQALMLIVLYFKIGSRGSIFILAYFEAHC